MTERRFVFICPTYNAEETCRQTILSVAAQSYTNWHMIVVNDMSTDDTSRTILKLFDALGLSTKLTYVFNKEKKWEIENTLIALNMCKDDDIICRLDMDDYCLNNATLEILNRAYQQDNDLEAVWTSHVWFSEKDGLTDTNISSSMPNDADPYQHPWVSSHMKTWKKHVSNSVCDNNYRGQDGQYFKRIGDQAFYLPVLKLAKKRGFLPLVSYAYRCDQSQETFQTDDAKFQAAEAIFLRKRGFIFK